jgi:hypothetical protein
MAAATAARRVKFETLMSALPILFFFDLKGLAGSHAKPSMGSESRESALRKKDKVAA